MKHNHNSKRHRGRPNGRRGSYGASHSMESSGPEVKIRGNATQLFEKYQALARDAVSSGDRIAAENYLQHAEHYYRVMSVQSAQNADSLNGGRPRGSRDRDRDNPPGNAAIAGESQETPDATPGQTSS
ncbi:MAG TPA: DUF4167 domain-containing protein [Acidobacteria bacterium]|nr:DUF4167 domain-containing protein [Acidobacteriota bacterium]